MWVWICSPYSVGQCGKDNVYVRSCRFQQYIGKDSTGVWMPNSCHIALWGCKLFRFSVTVAISGPILIIIVFVPYVMVPFMCQLHNHVSNNFFFSCILEFWLLLWGLHFSVSTDLNFDPPWLVLFMIMNSSSHMFLYFVWDFSFYYPILDGFRIPCFVRHIIATLKINHIHICLLKDAGECNIWSDILALDFK